MAFVPTDIAGCQIWLDANQIEGLNDGDLVTTWSDVSGAGNDAAQATATNKPTYKTNIVNGLPVVRFDGNDNYMKITDSADFKVANITLFIVAKKDNVSALQLLIDYPHTTSHSDPYFRWSLLVGGSWQMSHRWNGGDHIGANNGITADTWYVIDLKDNVSFRNGVSNASDADADLSYPNAVGIYIGSNVTPGEFWDGDIAEVILYDTSLSDANRTLVRDYLSDKYGISVPSASPSATPSRPIRAAPAACWMPLGFSRGRRLSPSTAEAARHCRSPT